MKTPLDEADKMRGGDNKGKRAFDGEANPLPPAEEGDSPKASGVRDRAKRSTL